MSKKKPDHNPYDKRRRGAPAKLTPAMIKEAEDLLDQGAMLGMLPSMLGVSVTVFNDWTRRANAEIRRRARLSLATLSAEELTAHEEKAKEEQIYIDFLKAVNLAIQRRDLSLIAIVKRAATGSPKVTIKTKHELKTTAKGTEDEPILDDELIITEKVETRSVEYDWRAAQYLLERSQPRIFGSVQTLDIRRALPVDPEALADLTLEELENLVLTLQGDIEGGALPIGGMDDGQS